MVARTLETIQSLQPKQAAYTRWILAFLVIGIVAKTAWFARLGIWHDRNLVDFDVFHIVAEHVWRGDVDQAYRFMAFLDMQKEASGGVASFMPWTYPPQFDLVVAPLAFLSTGPAYFVFMTLTLISFLAVLRSIAGPHFVLLLIVLFPAIGITIACGQNSFLTATLIGLVCLYVEERPIVAGLALGLMIVKPHLAVAFAVYAILRRRWSIVATAGAVVVFSSALCTAIFGTQIWTALLQSVRDSSGFLEQGFYPLFRMISIYAGLRTAGLSSSGALLGQIIVAALAFGSIAFALYRKLPTRSVLGLTAMLSVCISPYAYDYDFPIVGIGLALLLPDLQRAAREWQRAVIYIVPMVIGIYGHLQSLRLGPSVSEIQYLDVTSIGGFAVVALIVLVFTILLRASKPGSVVYPDVREPALRALG